MAALTKGRDGREMSEIGFLIDAGAIAFTDCDHVVSNPKVFARALSYACALSALVIAHPQEPTLSKGAAATSGKFASLRGLPAVSAMAERMGLDRDIALIEMTGARYHADQITTARALPALERAKAGFAASGPFPASLSFSWFLWWTIYSQYDGMRVRSYWISFARIRWNTCGL